MVRVALVANEDVVRVTPQSEHAVPATFRTWTEAIAYCKTKGYDIFDEEVAQSQAKAEGEVIEELLNSMKVEDHQGEKPDGEGSDG